VDGVNPSVCIRDFIISIGYMTNQSCMKKAKKREEHVFSCASFSGETMEARFGTYRISGSSTIEHGIDWFNILSPDSFGGYLVLNQLFVREEVNSISSSLAEKGHGLPFVETSYAIVSVYLLDSVKRTVIIWFNV
jgi:hypothetical protein